MSFMIAVPDGHSGSLYHCHVPLRSHMVAKDVSRCYINQTFKRNYFLELLEANPCK